MRIRKKGSLVKMLAATTLLAGLTLAIVTFAAYSHSIIIRSGGTINLPVGVGFYWESNCTNPVSFLDWGPLEPGSTKNLTLFVRNQGSQSIRLRITAENWNPIETMKYMIFSTNYNGQTINVQETLQIMLSLTTSSGMEGITSFSFDINVQINIQ